MTTLLVGFFFAATAVVSGLELASLIRHLLHSRSCALHATRSIDDDLRG